MKELTLTDRFAPPIVIGLGFFDCVHAGHRVLISVVTEYADRNACVPVLSTFSNNPNRMFNPDARVINTYRERLTLFQSLGIGHVLPFKFDAEFKKIGKTEFLDRLTDALNIKGIVCGYDYSFGYKGAGDAEYLKAYGKEKGITVTVVDPVLLDGERVSSTGIKERIERGDIASANRFLTDPFFMRGTVTAGNGRGRTYGFPTANLTFKKSKLTPAEGVYKTRATALGKTYPSVTSVGAKPTFADACKTVETYLNGFSGDLYDQEIKVEFLARIRGIGKFDSKEQLAEQIEKDLQM